MGPVEPSARYSQDSDIVSIRYSEVPLYTILIPTHCSAISENLIKIDAHYLHLIHVFKKKLQVNLLINSARSQRNLRWILVSARSDHNVDHRTGRPISYIPFESSSLSGLSNIRGYSHTLMSFQMWTKATKSQKHF